jgi:hypothetical protein
MVSVAEVPVSLVPEVYPNEDVCLSEDRLQRIVAEFDRFSSPGRAVESIGAGSLRMMFVHGEADLVEAIDEGANQLENGSGFFVLKHTGLEGLDLAEAHACALALSSLLGAPTRPAPGFEISGDLLEGTAPADRKVTHFMTAVNIYMEKVRHPNLFRESSVITNDMVTSSPYLERPEPVAAIYNVGSGYDAATKLKLVDGKKVIEKLKIHSDLAILRQLMTQLPFLLPMELRVNGSSPSSIVQWAKVIDGGNIRFDKHAIDAAYDLTGLSIPLKRQSLDDVPELSRALGVLDVCISEQEKIECDLEPGDVLFINNRRMLHEVPRVDDDSRMLIKVGIAS